MKNLRANGLPEALRAQIRIARHSQGLSQLALGDLVGLAQKHISSIENGHVVPRYDTLLDLLRALGLDMVVVPRSLTPLVESLGRDSQAESAAGSGVDLDQRSLYASVDDANDHDDELHGSGRSGEVA
jgi:transcriptional regulator with XRE-family HTH domain